jgi:hypothetical protein
MRQITKIILFYNCGDNVSCTPEDRLFGLNMQMCYRLDDVGSSHAGVAAHLGMDRDNVVATEPGIGDKQPCNKNQPLHLTDYTEGEVCQEYLQQSRMSGHEGRLTRSADPWGAVLSPGTWR